MGCYDYKNIWKPMIKGKLETRMEQDNIMDKFAVAMVKSEAVVGHIMKRKAERFAETVFYFLKANPFLKGYVEITGKAVNHGDLKGMRAPCIIKFAGKSYFIEVSFIEDKYLALS